MKKRITVIVMLLLTIGCNNVKEKIKKTIDNTPAFESSLLMDFDKYKNFSIDNVTSLKIIKYSEGGANEEMVSDLAEIKRYYEMLSNYKVIGTTKSACDDNTTIYRFIMQDGNDMTFEFECDWLVIGSSRYAIEKVK